MFGGQVANLPGDRSSVVGRGKITPIATWTPGEQTAPPDVYVYQNGTQLFRGDHSAMPATYSGTGLSVAAGDHIDFVVAYEDFQAVQLGATITMTPAPTPEPGTLTLLGAGLLGLLAYAWRKRR